LFIFNFSRYTSISTELTERNFINYIFSKRQTPEYIGISSGRGPANFYNFTFVVKEFVVTTFVVTAFVLTAFVLTTFVQNDAGIPTYNNNFITH
jgi:hypothetical protein